MFKTFFKQFRSPADPAGNLYYVRLKTPQATFYKLGYTNMPTLVARMSFGNHGDEKLIEKELLFCFRSDAYNVEQHLLHCFRKHQAFKKYSNDPTMPLPGRGQTELFNHDVLGLDDELYEAVSTQLSTVATKAIQEQELGCLLILVALVLAPFTFGFSLLLFFMGSSAFFGPASTVGVPGSGMPKAKVRPTHPPEVEKLIEDLKSGCSLRNPA